MSIARKQDIAFWHKRLNNGEQLAWVGRPGWGLILDKTALSFCVPALGACAAILTESKSLYVRFISQKFPDADVIGGNSMEETLFWTVVAATVYLSQYLWGHCVISPWTTRYALSNRRALVHNTFGWPRLRSTRLTPMSPIEWDGAEVGTIFFDTFERNYGSKPKSTKPTVVKTQRLGFRKIPDAPRVHALMQEVGHGDPVTL